jgi:Ca2+-binding RTX toxin-like protein
VTFAPINGTPADNVLFGTPLADTINGLAGNDTIFAAGNDRLNGGAGDDDLVAGAGTVLLSGGGGEDTYSLLGSATPATTTISDTIGIDMIDASQARAALMLDLSAGTGHVGQQQIVIDRPAPSAGLDVVFAQDVSGSIQADVVEIRSQIDSIVTAIQSFNANARIGVSSFVDKPFFPFGVAAEGDYIYRTDAALTADGSAIAAAYDVLISEFNGAEGGGDASEGQLEALQQIALRGAELGWSSTGTAKVVVLVTDSAFHQAPDVQAFFDAFFGPGSLGDPPPRAAPNNNDTVFDLDEEYPSIQQVRELLLAEHIIPVFAIPDLGTGVADQYQALVDLFGFGAVASLASGNSDVVGAVSEALGFAINGTMIENVIGTRFGDTIIGNDADNTLAGGGGNDTLDGGDGDDTLAGGRGDDIMTGGAGDDRFSANSLLDEVHELAGGGNDTVLTEVDFSLSGTELENILASSTAPGLILTGNDANNRIRGGDGGDVITGGTGADLLAGGDGDDTFVYTSVQDSTRDAGGWDRIADFLVGHDKIDLQLIDAVSGDSDDAFNFIGSGRFQHAGDLRVVAANNKTVISGDIDGDRVADFQIVLRAELSLSAADFML